MSSQQKVILAFLAVMVMVVLCLLGGLTIGGLFVEFSPRAAQPPAVIITDPQSGVEREEGQEVTISAQAQSEDKIVRMELWLDGALISLESSPNPEGQSPMISSQKWKTVGVRTHTATFRAWSASGVMNESAPIAIVVNAAAAEVEYEPPTPTATPGREQQIAPLWDEMTTAWLAADWPRAIELLNKIRSLDPTYDDVAHKLYVAYVNYGYALLQKGDLAGAEAQFQAALGVIPDGPEARAGLARLTPTPTAPTPTPTRVVGSVPQVKITSPGDGSSLGVYQAVNVQIQASDQRGIDRVELWVDGVHYGAASYPERQTSWTTVLQWKPLISGEHVLMAIAFNTDQVQGRSQPIRIRAVYNSVTPKVWFGSPASGVTIEAGQELEVQMHMTDEVGMDRIELWVDNVLYSTDFLQGQHAIVVPRRWTSSVVGDHTLVAKAYNALLNSSLSAPLVIKVVDTGAPKVKIETNKTTLALDDKATITATASDSSGIARLEWWVDNTLWKKDENPTGEVKRKWRGDKLGKYTIFVRAFDRQGQVGESNRLTLEVTQGPTPTPTPKPGKITQLSWEATLGQDEVLVYEIRPDQTGRFTFRLLALQDSPGDTPTESPHKPVDSDGDGVNDEVDLCPNQPGSAGNNGCPAAGDADGDGVNDDVDNCPNESGPAENSGCPWPDADGDGVPDDNDQCPLEPGSPENNGCPLPTDTPVPQPGDADGDGVNDDVDQCKDQPGPPENNGCPWPDADGDGVPDKDDQCPAQSGPANNNGCPLPVDSDGDGVNDDVDQCKDQPGPPENNGCPAAGQGALPITMAGLMENSLSLADLPLAVVFDSPSSAQNALTTYELTFYEGAVDAQSLASSGWGRDIFINKDQVQKDRSYFVVVRAVGGGGKVNLSYKIVPPGVAGLAFGPASPALLIGLMLVVLVLAGGGWWMVRRKEAEEELALEEEEAIEAGEIEADRAEDDTSEEE